MINNNSQNTSPKNQISIGTQGNNSPTILNDLIHGGMFNKTGGISISTLLSGSSSSSEIAYNEIFNNSYGIAMTGSNPITCYVHDNLIYNNNINPDVMIAGSGINTYGTAVVAPIISQKQNIRQLVGRYDSSRHYRSTRYKSKSWQYRKCSYNR